MTKSKKESTAVAEPLLSLGGNQVERALSAPDPKMVVLAKDMIGDELYSNVYPHTIGQPYKMHRLIEKLKNGKVKVTFYAENLMDWLIVETEPSYQFTIDPRYTDHMTKPIKKSKEERRARAAHLPKFQKTKPDPEKQEPHGKNVFKGKIGSNKVLLDVGDGSIVATIKEGQDSKKAAAEANRKLVSQGAASTYAMWNFTQQWKAARAKASV